MHCRVAAAQISLTKGSYEERIEDAQNLIHEASKSGAQIVCLPEHWLLEYWREANDAPDRLAKTAKTEHIFVITGANYMRNRSGNRIRSALIDADGRLVGWQDKVHLFRDERIMADPGENYEILQTPFAKLGITICYDNVFPEASRTLALRGAELLFVPSKIISEGLDCWLLYLRTRALENRMPVIAPNVFDPPKHLGGSVIIDLEESSNSLVVLPKILASAREGEAVIVADVDLERAGRLRANRLSERKTEAYSLQ